MLTTCPPVYPKVQPVLGPQAKAALRLDIKGQKRRKMLVLLAAYADAGQPSPSWRELGARLPFIRMRGSGSRINFSKEGFRKMGELMAALQREGWITVQEPTEAERNERYRATYTLHLDRQAR